MWLFLTDRPKKYVPKVNKYFVLNATKQVKSKTTARSSGWQTLKKWGRFSVAYLRVCLWTDSLKSCFDPSASFVHWKVKLHQFPIPPLSIFFSLSLCNGDYMYPSAMLVCFHWQDIIKTPEQWRPSRVVPSLSVFFPHIPSNTYLVFTSLRQTVQLWECWMTDTHRFYTLDHWRGRE